MDVWILVLCDRISDGKKGWVTRSCPDTARIAKKRGGNLYSLLCQAKLCWGRGLHLSVGALYTPFC
jgi:hypothetical protein